MLLSKEKGLFFLWKLICWTFKTGFSPPHSISFYMKVNSKVECLGRWNTRTQKLFLLVPACIGSNVSSLHGCFYRRKWHVGFLQPPRHLGASEINSQQGTVRSSHKKPWSSISSCCFILLKSKETLIVYFCWLQPHLFPRPKPLPPGKETLRDYKTKLRSPSSVFLQLIISLRLVANHTIVSGGLVNTATMRFVRCMTVSFSIQSKVRPWDQIPASLRECSSVSWKVWHLAFAPRLLHVSSGYQGTLS